MKVTEEPTKPPRKSEIRCAINTLSLHSVFVDHDCAEKIRKQTSTNQYSFIEFSRDILTAYTVYTSQNLFRMMWI